VASPSPGRGESCERKGVRWWLTPKPGVWCVKVSPNSPVAVPTQKGPRMSSNHFVWFHAGPCE